jgi:Holliday junction resolvase-like predicted endonuclease
LRRHGYILVARNFTSPGIKGEIDTVGYHGSVLAFVEVKTRTMPEATAATSAQMIQRTPEGAVKWEKRRNLSRMARQFLGARILKARSAVSIFWQSKRGQALNLACACTKLAFNADRN